MQPPSSFKLPEQTIFPLTPTQRDQAFGHFAYKPAPTADNPERIELCDSWAKDNLVRVALPKVVANAVGPDVAIFHRLVWPRFQELIDAWSVAGVDGDIVQWGGSYAARFIRGRVAQQRLSAHAWGSAFDINVPYNLLGRPPTAEGHHGSVLRLVGVAQKHGWAWGGHFTRLDPMHFELARL